MKSLKSKIAAITIAIFFILSMSASMMLIPSASAHTPPVTYPRYMYVEFSANPVGVGQQMQIDIWVNLLPPEAKGQYGSRWTMYLTVTAPNGKVTNFGPQYSDPPGGTFFDFTPTMTGSYMCVASSPQYIGSYSPYGEYPGNGIPGVPPILSQQTAPTNIGDIFLACTSAPTNFTVQSAAVPAYVPAPLPTSFWTYPISSQDREWSAIATQWLAMGTAQQNGSTTSFNWGTMPTTGHIMWTRPMWAGGISSELTGSNMYTTWHYDGDSLSPPIILDGVLYYNTMVLPKIGWWAVNLYTGATEFFHNTTGPLNFALRSDSSGGYLTGYLSFGQELVFNCPNQNGVYPYLWSQSGPGAPDYSLSLGGGGLGAGSTNWMMFDAFTGNWLCSLYNTTWTTKAASGASVTEGATGTQVYDPNGNICYYNIVNLGTAAKPSDYLQVWNSTWAIERGYTNIRNWWWCWRPVYTMNFNAGNGTITNVAIPSVQGSILAVRVNNEIIGGEAGANIPGAPLVLGNMWALSDVPGSIGTLLWNITYVPPVSSGNITEGTQSGAVPVSTQAFYGVYPEYGVFIFDNVVSQEWTAYSITTGKQLWVSAPEDAWDYYGMSGSCYAGMFISYAGGSEGGTIYAYNITTGALLWTHIPYSGIESPYGTYGSVLDFVCDGMVVYSSQTHHQEITPERGAQLEAVNVTNGKEVWGIDWLGHTAVTASGYVVGLNYYDNEIYCIGQGPSQTEVSAPNTAVSVGTPFLIKGTVMDISPGASQLQQSKDFPNGLPCVSDASEDAFMNAVYEDQAIPANTTGVPVQISAIDPNGNYILLGTATSDASGFYSLTVDTSKLTAGPGTYKVIASFAGSGAYYGSSDETSFVVTAAPTVAPTAPPVTGIASTSTVEYGVIAIIIVVIVIGIILAIMTLRKRP